ncbi:MAG: hypothetical protein O2955_12780 [Planctomycetota bacterium]|nr:hypothetical protein [Planctomycetota bacterium]MDA1213383.1 hypothetical protein [Planctomycetota bacterium]
MAKAYTPGLKVLPRLREKSRRILPITGEVLVVQGQQVGARDVVARSLMPGDVVPVNVANMMSISAGDVPDCLFKKEGDYIESGELIGRSKGIFGFFQSDFKSPATGTIESISAVTGQMIVRGAPLAVEVTAFLSGTIVEVIPGEGVVVEAIVSLIQGIFGIGGEAHGPLRMICEKPDQEMTEDLIQPEHKGCVLVGGSRMTGAAAKRAIAVGAAGIISGGMDDQDLKEILGYDLGVAVTGSERIGTTLILTEGFGSIAMAQRTFTLFKSREGAETAIDGTTQIRAGVVRPVIAIPWPEGSNETANAMMQPTPSVLEVGGHVRIIRDPYFGAIGNVTDLPHELQGLDSGSKARVLKVKVTDGTEVVVPRANVELIEG